MANIEKELVDEILQANGLRAPALGLRFDRVVVRVLGDLRSFARGLAPEGVAVLVTISAPIRVPAKTVKVLEHRIQTIIPAGVSRVDWSAEVHGNAVRLRIAGRGSNRKPVLIGFVHNPDADPKRLLDLAEQWIRAG